MSNNPKKVIMYPIGYGESYDRATILKLKSERITNELDRICADQEYKKLAEEFVKLEAANFGVRLEIQKLKFALYEVNAELWGVEDKLREIEGERQQCGDGTEEKYLDYLVDGLEKDDLPEASDRIDLIEFISLARSVYILNDTRARLKQQIDKVLGSHMREVKSYVSTN